VVAGHATAFIDGGDGDDVIDARAAAQLALILGGAGNDTIHCPDSFPEADGGAGDDTILGGDALIHGGAGNDRLVALGSGGTRLWGDDGADSLIGAAGPDWLDGGAGADQLYGGGGNDTYLVDSQADLVFEAAGAGIDLVIAGTDFYLYAELENLTLTEEAGDRFAVGNALANSLVGNQSANLLLGGAGNDSLRGEQGADSLFGETGNDNLFGGAGIDYLAGGDGDDFLAGDADADALYGEAGNDTLSAGGDFVTDILAGGAGNDRLIANSGLGDYDILNGGAGNDIYHVDSPDDIIYEGAGEGIDTVHARIAGAGYYLWAQVENCVLEGATPFAAGNDLDNALTGSELANWLLGNGGADRLEGGRGNDVLFGDMPSQAPGADTFVFRAGDGQDVIGDFQPGQDRIELIGIHADFAAVQAHMIEHAGSTAIDLGGGNLLVLQGVTIAQLAPADFVFG
jgi:Ca2+-binding RTX toxin-like protein